MLWEPRQASPHATHPAWQAQLPAAPTLLPRALHPFPPKTPSRTEERTVPRLCSPEAANMPSAQRLAKAVHRAASQTERGQRDGTGPLPARHHKQSLGKAVCEGRQGCSWCWGNHCCSCLSVTSSENQCFLLTAGTWGESPFKRAWRAQHTLPGTGPSANLRGMSPQACPQPLSHQCRGGSGGEPWWSRQGWWGPGRRTGLLWGLAEPAGMAWAP